jgi:uncharacterized membrane protein
MVAYLLTRRAVAYVFLLGCPAFPVLLGAVRQCPAQPPGLYLPIYAANEYSRLAGGYWGGQYVAVNNAGTAVGNADRYNGLTTFPRSLGGRVLRWDGSGAPAVELAPLAVSPSGSRTSATVWALNDAGLAVGEGRALGPRGADLGTRAVRWNGAGTSITELGNLGTDAAGFAHSSAKDVNGAGTSVGTAQKYDASHQLIGTRAVRWEAALTAPVELASPAEFLGSEHQTWANSINDAGMIVGSVSQMEILGTGHRPVRWDAAGVPTILGTLGSDTNGQFSFEARAINTAGTAIGGGDLFDASGAYLGYRAIRWDAASTEATELLGLVAEGSGPSSAFARAINDAGDVVGSADILDDLGNYLGERAVRWDAASTVATELDHLGFDFGTAHYINEAGTAVGSLRNMGEPTNSAVYWLADGTAVDLNSLIDPASGWRLVEATSISDTGWIAGWGQFHLEPDGYPFPPDSYGRMFLMHVPETSIAPPGVAGDFNNSGLVEQADLDLVLLNWGADATMPPVGWAQDLPNGLVDQDELDRVLLNWGMARGGASAAAGVPEPGTLALVAIASGLCASLRRRFS